MKAYKKGTGDRRTRAKTPRREVKCPRCGMANMVQTGESAPEEERCKKCQFIIGLHF